MQVLTRKQKVILIIFAVLDVLVIGTMAVVVFNASRNLPTSVIPDVTQAPTPTSDFALPTWTPGPTATPIPTLPPRLTNTPTVEPTPFPTRTPSPTPTRPPATPIVLVGADFDYVMPNRITGWNWDAYINYKPGDEVDSDNSYAEPLFTAADDPVRQINGGTLKIETQRWLKFRAYVYQTVTVTVGSQVYFEIKAQAFSSLDRLIVKAGIDPNGGENCLNARWGDAMYIRQEDGIVTLTSPRITVPASIIPQPTATDDESDPEAIPSPDGSPVTLCFFAEPSYAHVNNAAFFDEAKLVVVR